MEKLGFFFDIDGTLLNSEGKIMHNTIDSIKKLHEKGHLIGLATGRNPILCQDIIKILPQLSYIVGNNGSSIYNIKEGNLNNTYNIPQLAIDYMVKMVQDNKKILIWHIGLKTYKVIFCSTDEAKEIYSQGGGFAFESFDNWEDVKHTLKSENGITQITMKADKQTIIDNLEKATHDMKDICEVVEVSRLYIDFNPSNISKYTGIKEVCYKENININNVYAFGDSLNDYEMLKNLKNSVAMGNSENYLKEISAHTTDSNNDDGIYKFFLNNNLI
jgi:Cof subfamily protein (haloacid dehalogenase superfamily)